MGQAIMAGEREDQTRVEPRRPGAPVEGRDLKTLVNEYERQLILSALGATRGHQRRAARCLGISRATADRYWAYARAWLYQRLAADDG